MPPASAPRAASADSPSPGSIQQRILIWLVWIALALMLVSRVSASVVDFDIWHEMALFRESLVLGYMPLVDRFAYTATLPHMIHHEWGSGALAYIVSNWFGAPGIIALKYALAAVIAWFCWLVARNRAGKDALPVFSLIAPVGILFVGAAFSPIRAHLYSVAFVAAMLWLLEQDRAGGRRWIAIWFAMALVWLNMHAGFAIGIILMGAYAFEQLLRRRPWVHVAATAAATPALAMISPWGWHYYPFLWNALTMPRPAIIEWEPLMRSFPSADAVVFPLTLALILFLAFALGLRAMPGVMILCVTALSAGMHHRMVPFYAVAWTAYVPSYVQSIRWGDAVRRLYARAPALLQAAWLMIAVFFLEATVSFHPWRLEVPAQSASGQPAYPVGAVDYLAAIHFQGNVMTPFAYGAYVSWKLYPAIRVSIDSRYEVAYPDWWASRVGEFYAARIGWQRILTAYPTDIVLVARNEPVAEKLPGIGWNLVYADLSYEIYARPGLTLPAAISDRAAPAGVFP